MKKKKQKETVQIIKNEFIDRFSRSENNRQI